MHTRKKALLAAGLLAGAAAMTGCTATTQPVATPTPEAKKATAAPVTAMPADAAKAQPTMDTAMDQNMEPAGEDAPVRSVLLVDGKAVAADAVKENDGLLLPLVETAEALGWESDSQQTQGETQSQRIITLDKEDSRITVSWTVSDNTAKQITWQKDGLLIPVDARLTGIDDVIYVPAAFFEEAMDVSVSETKDGVLVQSPKPEDTPQTKAQELEGNG